MTKQDKPIMLDGELMTKQDTPIMLDGKSFSDVCILSCKDGKRRLGVCNALGIWSELCVNNSMSELTRQIAHSDILSWEYLNLPDFAHMGLHTSKDLNFLLSGYPFIPKGTTGKAISIDNTGQMLLVDLDGFGRMYLNRDEVILKMIED